MKLSSISLKATPPAVEIALASGAGAVRRMGTALISPANDVVLSALSLADEASAASCSSPMAGGDSFTALRSTFASDCLPRGASRARCTSVAAISGRSAMASVASPLAAMASRSGADSA